MLLAHGAAECLATRGLSGLWDGAKTALELAQEAKLCVVERSERMLATLRAASRQPESAAGASASGAGPDAGGGVGEPCHKRQKRSGAAP